MSAPKPPSGVFFRRGPKNRLKELMGAISYLIAAEDSFKVESCVENAREFSPKVFEDAWVRFLNDNSISFLPSRFDKDLAGGEIAEESASNLHERVSTISFGTNALSSNDSERSVEASKREQEKKGKSTVMQQDLSRDNWS